MDTASNRTSFSNIIAAIILGSALIGSALILSRPPAAAKPAPASALVKPPIAQEAVARQIREQVLAGVPSKTRRIAGKDYLLADIRVPLVVYNAEKDFFFTQTETVWQPKLPSGSPIQRIDTFYNDGYGHYYGPALNGIVGHTGVDIVIK